MRLLRSYIGLIYFLFLAVHCIAIYLEMDTLRFATKLLLVPLLLVMMSISFQRISALIYIAFICCWIGDLLLIRHGVFFFMLGMLAFIFAHIFNSINFYLLQDHQSCRLREAMVTAAVLIVLSSTVFIILNPYLGNLRIPILVYMIVISIMTILAAATASRQAIRHITFRLLLPGASMFVLSDTLLAINKFIIHDQYIDIPVMLLYGTAVYFLVQGFIAVTSLTAAKN